ncbi:MAG: LemA family protein [Pseudomonadota bacterium]
MSVETIVFLVVIVAVVGFFIMVYNRLIALRNRFKNAFSQIDVQLKRRYELIPNLVETAKSYMKHERETLESVISARNGAANAADAAGADPADGGAIRKLIGAESVLGSAMGGFFALAENYPDLKADATMMRLMEELSSTENRVAFARQAFNDSVMEYNTHREQFPNNIISGFFNFKEAEFFEIEEPEIREPVKVSF